MGYGVIMTVIGSTGADDVAGAGPREQHYGEFYGLRPLPPPDGRVVIVVFGNCQAESLRVLLDASPAVVGVRLPPVFELTAADLPHLAKVLRRADLLLAQPVRDDYAGLALGTRQIASWLRPEARLVRWPVIRWTGLHPFQGIVRDPRHPSNEPPLVPYHDLRTLSWAASGRDPWADDVSDRALHEVAALSLAELERRQSRDCDVGVADLLAAPQDGDLLTLNHPGNRLLIELARRIQAALDLPVEAADPGRVLLRAVIAPVPARIRGLWGLDGHTAADDDWTLGEKVLPAAQVHRVQHDWYRQHPWVVEAGLRRHLTTMRILGLA